MQKLLVTPLFHTLKGIDEMYTKISTAAAKACGLSKPEADVLLFLGNHPQYHTAKDIVENRGFSKAYISKAADSLLKKELLDIKVNNKDRRFQQLYVTEKAKESIEQLQQMQQIFINQLTEGIPQEELEIYMKVMEQFSKNAIKKRI